MKASIFAGLATGALASSVYPRQNSAGYLVINGTLTDIIGLVQALDTQVLAYTGGSDISAVTNAANAIVTKAEGSIPAVVATTNVTNDDEVLNIATLVGNPLEPAAKAVVKDLEAKKDLIQANNLCETAFSTANNIYNATSDLGFAIAAKIDNPTYGYLAVPLINELLAIIAEAQVAFNPSNCTDAGTTTTTTTSTSTSTITTGTTTGTTTITTTATATNTITYGGYPSSSPSSKPYGNSTTYYSASKSSSFSYGASSQPVKSSTYYASSISSYVASSSHAASSSYVASSSHAASSSYAASSGGSGGNGGSYPSSSAVRSSSYAAGPTTTGKVVYTGAAATIAPAGALVLAIAALLV